MKRKWKDLIHDNFDKHLCNEFHSNIRQLQNRQRFSSLIEIIVKIFIRFIHGE